jgi:hypothetical protein
MDAGCKELFGRSLFFVGAFGANDYLLSLAAKSIDEVRSFIPDVVGTISMAVEVSTPLLTMYHLQEHQLTRRFAALIRRSNETIYAR